MARNRGLRSVVANRMRDMTGDIGERLARMRELRIRPGELLEGRHPAREATELASQPVNFFGRSFNPGALGWGRHAYHNLGRDIVRDLRAPFAERGLQWAGFKDGLGLTHLGRAAADASSEAARAASRAALANLGGILAGTATTIATLKDGEIDWNFPDFSGLSLTVESPWDQEATEVGEFSYRESEALVQ
ncbi:hypothetical protein [Streptomyces litchfieldiae]|uniref:Uncharacterized protein n=1 Tax=Streptomyces litchfieldiae TaxID=3075543 RepID=A0ABU2MJ62_9ACTN|nr:hypothetical protein [Streptomyces sp. DSM 44938]MDT0341520.1 hypothetical protein [Streptomyces sp. DSM 44938]